MKIKLSIITINYNNATGLQKTMESVLAQTSREFEYIIIDGGSTDGSVEVIRSLTNIPPGVQTPVDATSGLGHRAQGPAPITYWLSEPDKGIYHAMNKGIKAAQGDYVQFLNSGDCLAAADVVEKMHLQLSNFNFPSILYGNMLKQMPEGLWLDRCFAGKEIPFFGMFTGTLNHSSAWIRRDLFEKYGLYDETLKIVSDWKWYLKAIIFGKEKPVYADIDVTVFDMKGISNTNSVLVKTERKKVLNEMFPPAIIADYEKWAFPISQMKRLMRYKWIYKSVWFIERCLFKYEKWFRNREQVYK